MARFHVVAIGAALLLAVSGPSFAAKRIVRHEECRDIAISRGRVERFSEFRFGDPPV